MEVVSKRNPYTFYLILFILNVLLLTADSFLFIPIIKFREGDDGNIIVILGFALIAFLALPISLNYSYFKNAPRLVLNLKGIYCKNEFYEWNDVENIKLTGKNGLIFFTPIPSASLTFKNKKNILIFDEFYENTPEMKCFIQDIVIDKKETFNTGQLNNALIDISKESFVNYKGIPVFSFRGIMMWIMTAMFIFLSYLFFKNHELKSVLVFTTLSFFWFFINSNGMNYIAVSENYLVIKNHYFVWRKFIYPISDIKEIALERGLENPKGSRYIRIITTKFVSKAYTAPTLTDNTWLKLKTALQNKNITIQ